MCYISKVKLYSLYCSPIECPPWIWTFVRTSCCIHQHEQPCSGVVHAFVCSKQMRHRLGREYTPSCHKLDKFYKYSSCPSSALGLSCLKREIDCQGEVRLAFYSRTYQILSFPSPADAFISNPLQGGAAGCSLVLKNFSALYCRVSKICLPFSLSNTICLPFSVVPYFLVWVSVLAAADQILRA